MFTDIQGSTPLWEHFKMDFMPILERHSAIVRQATGPGYEVRTEGDALFLAFDSPVDALRCAVESQQALQDYPWPSGARIQVRMGLHTGMPIVHQGDYFGPSANKAARIASAGHGGQILLSTATMELVRDDLPEEVSLVDLEIHRLRGICRPERLYQVSYPGMPVSFPSLKTLDVIPNNLPVQLTSFVGRRDELTELEKLLVEGDIRLITLTGPGGTGKTRLSLQLGAELLDHFPDGVWFVDLSVLREVASLDAEIVKALNFPFRPGASAKQVLIDYLRYKRCLLVLDNFEHLMDGVILIAELLQAAPKLLCVVTSREVLKLKGEREFPVSPLSFPEGEMSAGRLSQFEGVQLFLERAQAVQPDFHLTDGNGPAIAQLCHRLDGIPLAIELAAARVRGMTPQEILKRLEQKFDVLSTRQRDVPARHRTLRQTMDWSYDLLLEEDKDLFAQLSVFVGGFFLEQAEAVCESFDVLEGVFSLKDKSLLRVEELGGQMRYRMLEMVRAYAGEKLGAEGERIRRQHAAHFLSLAERWAGKMRGSEEREASEGIALELDNLKAGMDWAREAGEDRWDGAYGLALGEFFDVKGLWAEGRERLLTAEEALRRVGDDQGMVQVLGRRATYCWRQGEYVEAQRLFVEGLGIAREGGDREGMASCLNGLGRIADVRGEHAEARKLYVESLDIRRELDDRHGIAISLNNLGAIVTDQGDYAEARRLFTESLNIGRDLGDRRGTAHFLNNLGAIAADQGDYDEARKLYVESLGIWRDLGDQWGIASPLNNLGAIAADQGDYVEARRLFTESLEIWRDLGDRQGIAYSLNSLGRIVAAQGDCTEAWSLLDESLQIARELGDQEIIADDLSELGGVALEQKKYPEAHRLLRESLKTGQQSGLKPQMADALHRLGQLAQSQGNTEWTLSLLIVALRLYGELSSPKSRQVQADLESLREALGEERFSALHIQAEQKNTEEVLSLALQS
jgi:predicted ATPase/class 3 adenylate cyclase/Tfp pilus assembly protein PilF